MSIENVAGRPKKARVKRFSPNKNVEHTNTASNESNITDVEFEEQKNDNDFNENQNSISQGNDIENDNQQNEFPKQRSTMRKPKQEVVEDVDEQMLRELEESEGGSDDIPSDNYNPLQDGVINRGYTKGMGIPSTDSAQPSNEQQPPIQERIIPEPNYHSNGASGGLNDVDDGLINPSSNSGGNNNGGGNNGGSKSSSGGGGNNNGGGGSGGGKSSGGGNNSGSSAKSDEKREREENLKELDKKQKKEAMENTADALLLAYKNYLPIPFIYFASYKKKKLEKLHENGEIDLETPVKKDGTTFREHTVKFNKEVEQAFEISDDEVKALKEPLVDVLMEQDFAFTPTQRLMFVGGQFLVAKIMMAGKFMMEMKSDMDEMKEMHKEKMDAHREQMEIERLREKKERDAKIKRQEELRKTQTAKPVQKEEAPATPESTASVEPDITEATIISMEVNKPIVTNPTLDDALAGDGDGGNNDNKGDEGDIPE